MIVTLKILGYLIFAPLIWQLGNGVVRLLLDRSSAQKSPAASQQTSGNQTKANLINLSAAKSGRYIGLLERLMIVVGVVTNRWDIIAAVVALKTVARYKELDDKITAEYFLVGSLTSILWAVLMACALIWYDNSLGFHLILYPNAQAGFEQKHIMQYISH
jgi:hypothetical protein